MEIGSTFYGAPRPSMVDNWRRRTPDGFRFAAKLPQVITHEQVVALPLNGRDFTYLARLTAGIGSASHSAAIRKITIVCLSLASGRFGLAACVVHSSL